MIRALGLSVLMALGAAAASAQEIASAPGAALRALDTVSGHTEEIDLDVGQTTDFGHLRITLNDCRYPAEDASSDAYASLVIIDRLLQQKVFDGWMIASSPALNALDHWRYDVWVLRCRTSSTATDGG